MLETNYYYRNLFKTQYKILKYAGLWTEDEKHKNTKLFRAYTLFVNMIYIIFSVSHSVQSYLIIDNIPEFANTCYMLVGMLMIHLKSITMFMYRNEVAKLNKLMEVEEFQIYNETHKMIADKNVKTWKVVRRIQYSGVTIECVLFLVGIVVGIITNQDRSLQLPGYWFPFDFTKSPTYEFVLIYHIANLLYSAIAFISFQMTVAAYFTFISIQCDLLCYNLRHIKEKPEANASQFECNLSTCVQHYAKLIR